MQIGPRIRFDRHTLGNLAKNISPALAFTPLGLAGTGIAAGLGEIGRGKHGLGDIAKSVSSNVAIGAGARGVAGHFGVGPSAAHAAAPPPASPALGALPSPTALPAAAPPPPAAINPGTPDLLHVNPGGMAPSLIHGEGQVAPPGEGGALSALGKVGTWAGDHDKTTSSVLNGLGNLGTMGAQNRKENAQAALLEQQQREGEYNYNTQKARDLAMEPLRQALYGRLAFGPNSAAAPNPYAHTRRP